MRTALFLLAGFLLLAGSLLLGRLFSANYPGATTVTTVLYAILWIVIAGVNMWIGVAKAGYSVAEELPIFALIAGVPVAAAIILKLKFL